ncbi:unnamed protein product [marine sediment metagenome]|uniref:Uncharacterized protein n=1 Tax=marine sediment metagenome TaxID=412755 RepID=X1MVW1_9ZZZZ
MKLEIDRLTIHRIYARARWKLENLKLIQTIPIEDTMDPFESTLRPGDNIRLDGKAYHVDTKELARKIPHVYIIYNISEGHYTPSGWIGVGKVEV